MRTRAQLEQIEDQLLAPYAARSSRSEGRAHDESEHGYRTAYQRDRDRIVHCAAFRRLEYKTQVFVNTEGDYYRTRLTHTLEVAQIARTVARTLGLNEDLTEALALVHDLGHAPFGHAGEDALTACLADHGGFEHNAQSLRIVTTLERRYAEFPGLNLTYETREGMAKHGDYRRKGSAADYRPDQGPLLEAVVADRADRLAYNHHDLDDALTADILSEREVRELPHVDEAFDRVDREHPGLSERVRVHHVCRSLINASVGDLVRATTRRLADARTESVEDVRSADGPLVVFSEQGATRHEDLHRFLYDRFYRHWRVVRMQENAKRYLRTVFEYACTHPGTLPPVAQQRVDQDGLERAVADYVAGMTDRELHAEYRAIVLP